MNEVIIIKSKEKLKISSLKKLTLHKFQINLSDNALGVPWRVPVIILRGKNKGPCMGITAAVHGNELNGIPTIFKLIDKINLSKLSGTLALLPIVNVPGYLLNQRNFIDNIDLNRIMPGKPNGNPSEIFSHLICTKVVKQFDYHLDLHTASVGRINSLYIRADIDNPVARKLAYLQNPQIIVKKYDETGTLRAWANENNIPSITIEIGNPNAFQHKLIDETLHGILNTLKYLKMIPGKHQNLIEDASVCDRSFWINTSRGGIVDVHVGLTQKIKKNQKLATVYDVFGNQKEILTSPENGIVIGKNTNPNCDAGTRIVHLGVDFL